MIPNSLSLDLEKAYNILNFFINKAQGAFFTYSELDNIGDTGQLRYYKICFQKYGTSQRLNDALAPFKKKAPFTTDANGLLTVPDDYMDLISILPVGALNCPVINDDEIAYRKKSQVINLSLTRPFAEETSDWNYQLYPQQVQSGTLSYFMRPPAPKFVYTTISGRVVVYDKTASTQFLWGDDEIASVLLAALEDIGINLSEADILNWADQKNQQNFSTIIKS